MRIAFFTIEILFIAIVLTANSIFHFLDFVEMTLAWALLFAGFYGYYWTLRSMIRNTFIIRVIR